MILDRLDRLGLYRGLFVNLDFAIDCLEHLALDKMENGQHELLGDDVHLLLMDTELSEPKTWEAHRKYIDLQMVLLNQETISWAPIETIRGFSAYQEEQDVMTSDEEQAGTACVLQPGMFAIFFPDDAHKPGIGQGSGRKAVFKIKLEPSFSPVPHPSPLRHLGTQRLQSRRLVLRPYQIEDAQQVYDHWANDPEVTRTLQWETHPDVDHTRKFISEWVKGYESGQSYHWGIEKDGELIGDIALMRWSEQQLDGEIGYCLSRQSWNQGLMTEALTRVLRFLFTEVGFRRILLRHDVKNPASGRVMQKAGMKLEGCERQALIRKEGDYADVNLYAALKDEWLPLQEPEGND